MGLSKETKLAVMPGGWTPQRVGETFYVGNSSTVQYGGSAGADGGGKNRGKSPKVPFATLVEAVAHTVANRCDVIVLMPGHAEDCAAAGKLSGSTLTIKAGTRIVGLGDGTLTPKITFKTATTADLDIDNANITLENINFVVEIDAAAAPIDVNAAQFRMVNCRATVADATYQAVRFILTDANASGMRLIGCTFLGQTTVGAAGDAVSIVTITDGNDILIENCRIEGRCTEAIGVIENLTTGTTGVVVRNCELANWTTNSTKCIDTVAATVLKVVNCDFIITDNATLAPVDLTGIVQLSGRNYVTNTTDETGALVGTVSA